jgi:hypothetical protein
MEVGRKHSLQIRYEIFLQVSNYKYGNGPKPEVMSDRLNVDRICVKVISSYYQKDDDDDDDDDDDNNNNVTCFELE